jgi:hypothetical protein
MVDGLDLLEEFGIKIYEAPASDHRDSGRIADTSDPISVAMLVIDFRTEVEMNGMVDVSTATLPDGLTRLPRARFAMA